jgi:colanic acid/amylovoran biosynthesis glycosyltransferase
VNAKAPGRGRQEASFLPAMRSSDGALVPGFWKTPADRATPGNRDRTEDSPQHPAVSRRRVGGYGLTAWKTKPHGGQLLKFRYFKIPIPLKTCNWVGKLKIAFITNQFPVLYNSFTVNEILGLSDRGCDVSVYSISWARLGVSNENALAITSKVKYFPEYWPRYGFNRFLGLKLLGLSSKLAKNYDGINKRVGRLLFLGVTPKLPYNNYFNYFGWNVYAFDNLAKEIMSDNVDIIHGAYGNRPATAAMLLSKLSGVPFTFEAHAYDLFVDFPFAREKIDNAKMIFTISNYNKEHVLKTYGCARQKIAVMRVPINKRYCDLLDSNSKKDHVICTVSRLHPIKGIDDAIDAVSIVKNEYPEVKYHIVGDGLLEEKLKSKVKALSLEDNVVFHGELGNEAALKILAESSLFLLPSKIGENGDRDGIPTSMIEAMYLKTPVVSTNVSGIPELVDTDVNGYLVEPNNPEELAKYVRKIIANKNLRIEFGEHARKKVSNKFYNEECYDVLIGAWRKISELMNPQN